MKKTREEYPRSSQPMNGVKRREEFFKPQHQQQQVMNGSNKAELQIQALSSKNHRLAKELVSCLTLLRCIAVHWSGCIGATAGGWIPCLLSGFIFSVWSNVSFRLDHGGGLCRGFMQEAKATNNMRGVGSTTVYHLNKFDFFRVISWYALVLFNGKRSYVVINGIAGLCYCLEVHLHQYIICGASQRTFSSITNKIKLTHKHSFSLFKPQQTVRSTHTPPRRNRSSLPSNHGKYEFGHTLSRGYFSSGRLEKGIGDISTEAA